MKHFKIVLILCIAVLAACKKDKNQFDNGCINQPDLSVSQLSKTDQDKVNAFLKANNITINFVAQRISADTNYQYGHYTPTIITYSTRYTGYQIVNKLPILNKLIYYQDRDKITQYGLYPRIYDNITLSPTQKSTITDVKATYIYLIEKLHNPTLALPNAPYAGKHYADSCLTVKFGYYDTSADGYYLNPPHLVRAWEISPKSGTPLLRINDETLTFIDGTYPDKLYINDSDQKVK